MKIADQVKQLALAAEKDPSHPIIPSGIDDISINEFESRTGLTVPAALREWLRYSNGPALGAGGMLGVRTSQMSDDIECKYRRRPDWLERGWIPIARDGCGNYYVIATREQDGPGNPVFFLDRQDGLIEPSYVVASGLWTFLRFYLQHDLGESGWPFDPSKVLREDPALAHYTTVPKPWERTD